MSATLTLPLLDSTRPERFPNPRGALRDPNGLLAFGGDLSARRLLAAYSQGIFPWFNEDEPILWWSPDPRCVFHTGQLQANRSLRRQLSRKQWHVTIDYAFRDVVLACAEPRPGQLGTWIIPAMIQAYDTLHHSGHAHSIEVWEGERLVGGIYGVAVGRLFCGESMFSRESGGSKLALIALARLLRSWDFPLIDAQVTNPHLLSMGAVEYPRAQFLRMVAQLNHLPGQPGPWAMYTPHLTAMLMADGLLQ
ncbi:leucyl/phenylalanyl-tRNA--protein transferase [Dyella sp.]|uniref:leucyl/phenylalanyl-tRNA--protein transferase n=1 Tax=Dyella sp. TaxID=1869338 RepID=UPI002ED3A138